MRNKVHVKKPPSKEETIFYTSLKPIFNIAGIIGAIPLTLALFHDDNSLHKRKLNKDLYYTLFYLFFYLISSSFCLYRVLTDEENYIVIPKSVIFIESLFLIILIFVNIISGYVFRELLVKTIRTVTDVDRILKKIGIIIDKQRSVKNVRIILSIMFLSIILRTMLVISTVRIDFVQQFTLFLATFMKSLSKYQFMAIIIPICDRFSKVNSKIKTSFPQQKFYPRELNDLLDILCRLHYRLCNACHLVNTTFGVQLFFSIAVSLSDILFQSYYLYVGLSRKFDVINGWMIACPIMWLADEFLEIYLLVNACTTICILIQMYSLQMIHQKIQFSALGFFDIDYSLIYSIGGAVTTYLVIFIQFDQARMSSNMTANITTI